MVTHRKDEAEAQSAAKAAALRRLWKRKPPGPKRPGDKVSPELTAWLEELGAFAPPSPKSIEQLAREQSIDLDSPPDYAELASKVWRSDAEVRAFDHWVKSIRRPSHG